MNIENIEEQPVIKIELTSLELSRLKVILAAAYHGDGPRAEDNKTFAYMLYKTIEGTL